MPGLRSVVWSTAASLKVSMYSNLSLKWMLTLGIRKSSVSPWLGCGWVAFKVKVFWSKGGRQCTEYQSCKTSGCCWLCESPPCWTSCGCRRCARISLGNQDLSRVRGAQRCRAQETTAVGRACGVPPLSAQQQITLGAEETLWQTLSHHPQVFLVGLGFFFLHGQFHSMKGEGWNNIERKKKTSLQGNWNSRVWP